jgi:hypothetical protein
MVVGELPVAVRHDEHHLPFGDPRRHELQEQERRRVGRVGIVERDHHRGAGQLRDDVEQLDDALVQPEPRAGVVRWCGTGSDLQRGSDDGDVRRRVSERGHHSVAPDVAHQCVEGVDPRPVRRRTARLPAAPPDGERTP